VLIAWREMQGDARKKRITEIERKQKAIREELDRWITRTALVGTK